ncbi:MAG: hypothetical protein HY966_02655 [Ignavibacteriales bacterium]|nr:hypothetical protein [Ignavibacteriales bacterium]
MKTRILFVHLLLFSVAIVASAGDPNIRGSAMARTAVATSRSIEAFGINPANLAIPDRGFLAFGLAPTSFRVSTELFSYDIYKNYFTGVPGPNGERTAKYLTDDDKNTIMSILPDLAQTRFEIETTPISLWLQLGKIGTLGFAVTEHFGFIPTLNKDFFRVVMFGLPEETILYNFDGTGFSAWLYQEYNFSYAREIPLSLWVFKDLYAGFSVKLIQGYGVLETPLYKSSFGTTLTPALDPARGSTYPKLVGNFNFLLRRSGIDLFDESKKSSSDGLPEPAGTGTGIDFGLSSELDYGIRVAASVTDIGKIDWTKNIVETSGRGSVGIDNPFNTSGTDSLKDAIKGEEHPGQPFSTDLPTRIRVGVSMQSELVPFLKWFPGKVLLAADYTQGLNESMGNTTKPRVSLGAEWRIIPLLPLRTGFAFGGGDVPRWAFGFGLDVWVLALDVSVENFGMLFSPEKFQMFQLGAGLRIRI